MAPYRIKGVKGLRRFENLGLQMSTESTVFGNCLYIDHMVVDSETPEYTGASLALEAIFLVYSMIGERFAPREKKRLRAYIQLPGADDTAGAVGIGVLPTPSADVVICP